MKRFSMLQKFFLAAALLLFFMGLVSFRLNVGTVLLWLLGSFLAGIVVLQRKTGRKQIVLTGIALGVVAGLIVHAIIWNYFAFGREPEKTGEATVIVLGCKVHDEEPSLMLKRRLLRAKEYLEQNPMANCVVSGGLGENEEYTEAHVMKKFLAENGVDADRIYEENRSVNTDTNISCSLKVIREENLSDNLVICTDGFHQLRAWMYVRRNGMDAAAISGRTSIWVIPSYAIRELGGIFKMLIIG